MVYDKSLKKLAVLEKAFDVSYEQVKNGLATASFKLLLSDDKNTSCQTFNYIKLYDNGIYVDTFRILPSKTERGESNKAVTYACEHALGSMLDTVLFQYMEIGGIASYTETVLKFLLSKQKQWILGTCDFKRQFQYSWENENLLSAVWAVPKAFDEDCIFTWDTTVFPFVLNLVRPNEEVKSYIRYNRNMKGITKTEDGSVVCTKLYALGYGEGINQLNIVGVNPTKKPFVEAEPEIIQKYGVIEKIWVDRRYIVEENLYAAALAKLDELKSPRVSYEVDATELHGISGLDIDKFNVGDTVRVIDKETGTDLRTFIIRKTKSNIERDYISASLTLSNERQGLVDNLADLSKRAQINETYSQGATNITTYNFQDNCDPNFPAELSFVIPNEAVRINKVLLSFKSQRFRAYSRSVSAASQQTQSTTTQAQQTPSTTVEAQQTPSTTTSSQQTPSTTTSPQKETSTYAGGGTSATSNQDATSSLWLLSNYGHPDVMGNPTNSVAAHKHGLAPHMHDHSHSVSISAHSHTVTIDGHNHTVTIPGHSHTVTIPSHSHTVTIPAHNHTVLIPEHTHAIQYGIYEGPQANRFTVTVDGKTIPVTSAVDTLDIVEYLSKDGGGKINRGRHEIRISPNDLCRIAADVAVQFFVNSQGGGSY